MQDWIIGLGPSLVAIIAIWVTYQQWLKGFRHSKSKDERDEIYKRLNEFYGPIMQLRKKSFYIYKIYKEKYVAIDPDFSTLTYLLSGKTFSGNDDILLKEVIKIGHQCEKLIQKKAGLIDDSKLSSDLLPRAITHYKILNLAYSGHLQGEVEKYKQHTFPTELDEHLERRIAELQGRLATLNSGEN